MEIRLRPETPADEPFLMGLFATTRADEMACLAGAPAALEALVRMQFQAQKRAYEAQYPAAERSIVLIDGAPAGRLLVDRSGAGVRLVDIALLPRCRGGGAGTALLTSLLDDARRANLVVALHVLRTSPAQRLYTRLGFARTGGTAMHDAMEWRPVPRAILFADRIEIPTQK